MLIPPRRRLGGAHAVQCPLYNDDTSYVRTVCGHGGDDISSSLSYTDLFRAHCTLFIDQAHLNSALFFYDRTYVILIVPNVDCGPLKIKLDATIGVKVEASKALLIESGIPIHVCGSIFSKKIVSVINDTNTKFETDFEAKSTEEGNMASMTVPKKPNNVP